MRGCGRRGREAAGEAGKKGRERGAEGGGGGEGEGGKEEKLPGKCSRGEGESSGGFAVPAARCPHPGRLVPPAAPLRWNLLLPSHFPRVYLLGLAFKNYLFMKRNGSGYEYFKATLLPRKK